MTAAYRLRGIGWFGGCVAAVLGFYLVSLHVAGERKKLDLVNRRIAAAERDIRALETEFDTRANLVQLEKWNGDTLALTAPVAGQFVSDEAALASVDVSAPLPGAPSQGLRQAALVVPSGTGQPVRAMTLVAADAPRAAVAAVAAATVAKVAAVSTPVSTRATDIAVVRAAAAVAKVRPEAVAALDRKLLSDSTLGAILSGARTEAGPKR
ncbi:hypothetical protein GCM10011380_04780 [Sphingomonas metalli]|uniref:Uncharacterized protein n=1 Tax=Sphingomonas metalli TaxID=1779358 RepID=A0A916SVS4_9SPHN|nr:hypothetical protein [Sphingomonas metalli]GGB18273.1 hypothetical protein GCM10011380_04780 [Sphingomonas metalli]